MYFTKRVLLTCVLFTINLEGEASDASKCNPFDTVEVFRVVDNTQESFPLKSVLSIVTGVTVMSKKSERKDLYNTFTTKLRISKATEYFWNQEPWSTFSTPETRIVEFEIPRGIKAKFSQVIGECEPFTVRASKVLRRDYDAQGRLINTSYI